MLWPLRREAVRYSLLSSSPHPAFFHSTPVVFAKWKSKFDDKDGGRGQRPPKNYIRYVVRQKRADAKRALKDLLNDRCSNPYFQDEDTSWHAEESSRFKVEDSSNNFDGQPATKNLGKSKPHHSSGKHKHKGSKRKKNKWSFCSDDDNMCSDTVFQATFGNRCYTWSFRPWNDVHSRNRLAGFEWRDGSNWTENSRVSESSESDDDSSWTKTKRTWQRESDFDDDDNDNDDGHDKELRTIGSYSHRLTLGLPPTGPLKLDDVKTAFRVSALKWHPDKHQGPSQSVAEDKFRRCLDAYKYLCNALNSA
uniref:DnaJ subfamily A member 1 n=1 Tax=Anthurium amnicola TaxID=1678845 RepID=A0A1D1Y5S8_9ARAE